MHVAIGSQLKVEGHTCIEFAYNICYLSIIFNFCYVFLEKIKIRNKVNGKFIVESSFNNVPSNSASGSQQKSRRNTAEDALEGKFKGKEPNPRHLSRNSTSNQQ